MPKAAGALCRDGDACSMRMAAKELCDATVKARAEQNSSGLCDACKAVAETDCDAHHLELHGLRL